MGIRRTILVGILIVLAAWMAACRAATEEPPAQGNALQGTEWVLISLNGQAPIEGREVTLRFGDTSIEGSGGCNTYGGTYAASADSLSLSDLYWTEMACMEPEGIMAQEQAYLQALNAAAGYRVEHDRLELYDEAGTQILAFVASTSAGEVPANTTSEFSLGCTLDVDETVPADEPVTLCFALSNPTARPLYVLTWYTPLEGMAGEIFQVTRDGQTLPYQGMLAKRGDPTRDEYVVIEPGETASTEVDLRTGYDLSAPGSYQVRFTAGLQDVVKDGSLLPRKRDGHQPQSLPCNTVDFSVVPAPETSSTTAVAAATPIDEIAATLGPSR
jgi:peptidyl-Lys metalloendopeptidase